MGNRMGGGRALNFPTDKRIVVVGGGYGGFALCSKLMKSGATFTLIDARDAMHHNMAAVRAVAIPGFSKQTLLPFKPKFGSNFVHGKVVDVHPHLQTVKLASGEEIRYDTLVLATGTTGPFPCKIQDQNAQAAITMYEDMANKVKSSDTITVIGGGAAGVELASEIATAYPKKKVTLIHSHQNLVAYKGVSQEFQNQLIDKLKGFNINLKLNQRVKNLESLPAVGAGTVVTDKGEDISGDLVIKATGLHVSNGAYAKSELANVMEKNGALQVNSYLQINGHPNIYALGDCNNTPETKLAFAAEKQAWTVANNISSSYDGKPLMHYSPGRLPMVLVLALGQGLGMAQHITGRILPDFMANKMKARDVFVASYWKKFGQSPP